MRITSWYPNFNGSHFGLPPSSIHRMTGLCGNFPYTMTYAHSSHCLVPNLTNSDKFDAQLSQDRVVCPNRLARHTSLELDCRALFPVVAMFAMTTMTRTFATHLTSFCYPLDRVHNDLCESGSSSFPGLTKSQSFISFRYP